RRAGRPLRDRDQLAERLGIVEGERGEDLAIDLDRRGLQTGDQPAVGHAVLARGRVDADDPEIAERALALLAVAVGVGEPALDRLPRLAIGLASSTDVALRHLHRLLVPAARLRAAFRAWHRVLLRALSSRRAAGA